MDLFFWGGTGKSKVLKPIVEADGHVIKVLFDPKPNLPPPFPVNMFSDENKILDYIKFCQGFITAIGGTNGEARYNISIKLATLGLIPINAIHKEAYIADSVQYGKGIQAVARATITDLVIIGDYCVFNTNCTVDHECIIGNGVHIMGGANLASNVQVGDYASIGTNATILPGIKIGARSIVGAGAVVTKHVEPNTVVIGVPAKPYKKQT